MKKVVTGDELKKCVMDAIHMLCDTAKITLGPKGSNVLISSEECSPYITNDGVTIARNIQSEDAIINAILEVAKEASLKTNEIVGDGTTTTLVLLEKMVEQGYAVLRSSYNELTLRKEMEQAIIAHYKRLGFNNYENIVKTKTDSEIATMYYEILDEIEEYADSDIED